MQKNVLGGDLRSCCDELLTGYFRNGHCETDKNDIGMHTVCANVTKEFLEYFKSKGNDLTTPYPDAEFPGLKPGDKWCLCAQRSGLKLWKTARRLTSTYRQHIALYWSIWSLKCLLNMH